MSQSTPFPRQSPILATIVTPPFPSFPSLSLSTRSPPISTILRYSHDTPFSKSYSTSSFPTPPGGGFVLTAGAVGSGGGSVGTQVGAPAIATIDLRGLWLVRRYGVDSVEELVDSNGTDSTVDNGVVFGGGLNDVSAGSGNMVWTGMVHELDCLSSAHQLLDDIPLLRPDSQLLGSSNEEVVNGLQARDMIKHGDEETWGL